MSIKLIQPFRPLVLGAAPVQGTLGTKQKTTAVFVGSVTVSGSIQVTVTSALIPGSLVFSIPVIAPASVYEVASLVSNIIDNNATLATHFNFDSNNPTNGHFSLEAKVAAANDATLNIAYTNGTAAGLTPDATSNATTAGVAPVAGTQGTFKGQLGELTVSSKKYTFRLISLLPMLWEGATPGLLFDPNPTSGVPRWRMLEFTGTGDDHTTQYVDL
jgi:hypothetical protein